MRKRWVILALPVMVAALVFSLSLWFQRESSKLLLREIDRRDSAAAELVGAMIQNQIFSSFQMLQVLGTQSHLVGYFERGEWSSLREDLQHLAATREDFDHFLLFDSNGNFLTGSREAPIPSHVSREPWFRRVIETQREVLNPAPLLLAVPFIIRGKVGGVLAAYYRVEIFADLLAPVDLGKKGALYLVDAAGKMIARSPPDVSPKNVRSSPIIAAFLKGQNGMMEIKDPLTGSKERSYLFRIEGLGWGVIASQEMEEAFAPVRALTGRLTFLGIFVLLVFGSAASLWGYSYQRNREVLKEKKKRLERSEIHRRILIDLASDLDLDRILEGILQEGTLLLKMTGGAISLWEGDKRAFVVKKVLGRTIEAEGSVIRPEGIASRIAETGSAVLEERYGGTNGLGSIEAIGMIASIGASIRLKDEMIGVMTFCTTEPDFTLSADDQQTVKLLASEAAVAICNAQLFREVQDHAERISTLIEATGASQNLTQLLEIFSKKVEKIIPLSWVGFISIGEGAPERRVHGISLFPEGEVFPLEGTAFGEAVRRRAPFIRTASEEIRYPEDEIAQREGFQCYGYIPLIGREGILGFLGMACRAPIEEDALQAALPLIRSLTPALENALLLEEIKRASRIKSEFISTVSHELRTPINNILGFTLLLLEEAYGAVNPKQKEALGRLSANTRQLLNLIDDILDLSRIEAGRVRIEMDAFDLREPLQAAWEGVRGLIEQKPTKVFWEIEERLPRLIGDKEKTRRVLLNLLSNAAKFTERGSIKIIARNAPDREAGGRTSNRGGVEVSIEDTGIGIAPEDLPRIFEKFHQVNSSLTRSVGGAGLGLAIVKNLMMILGGSVKVRSEIGKGSAFTVFFPYRVPSASVEGQKVRTG